jgi:hypothetical protein
MAPSSSRRSGVVPVALRALNRGGILSIAGIHLSDVPMLNYEREMFYEREIRSVTANTRADGEAFLRFAADHHLRVTTHEYPLAHAQQALKDQGGPLRRSRRPDELTPAGDPGLTARRGRTPSNAVGSMRRAGHPAHDKCTNTRTAFPANRLVSHRY